jgi:hypothetical protein
MEFAPNVGILVLGVLKAQGLWGQEIIMRPMTSRADLENNKVIQRRHTLASGHDSESIRLCTGRNCTVDSESYDRETSRWTIFVIYLLKNFKRKLRENCMLKYAANYSCRICLPESGSMNS